MSDSGFQMVRLANGTASVHSLEYDETMHPGLGPAAEAETLYARQLRIVDRLREHGDGFVVWDVGLGAAANALAVIRAAAPCDATLSLSSFDASDGLLRFAIEHARELGYLDEFIEPLQTLVEKQHVSFVFGRLRVDWQLTLADFPAWICSGETARVPKPHAILFDPYSPARNPSMWTATLFEDLFSVLEQSSPCALATYSRSTMTRVALLLGGFFVGVGEATGAKEETTIASNSVSLIPRLLDWQWLERIRKSTGAEPLREAVYRQAPLTDSTWARLEGHPQFRKS
ncbi:MAG: hypothetical protein QOF48_2615 [Verrucomicrobiota bacterium]|jgi:tRNA U34 5-methylaminomethyl-2-thiouridine-forming methyltransferase MnmC